MNHKCNGEEVLRSMFGVMHMDQVRNEQETCKIMIDKIVIVYKFIQLFIYIICLISSIRMPWTPKCWLLR